MATTEIIERAAQAAYEAYVTAGIGPPINPAWASLSEREKDIARAQARAVIQAMREPTEAMVAAAVREEVDCTAEAHRVIHRAMIDAALAN